LIGAALAAGCTSIPQADAMRAHEVGVAAKQPASVGVRVSGGQDFGFRISDAAFEAALRDSLADAGMFSRIVAPDAGDFRLDVVLGDEYGVEGRAITVLWSLSRTDTRETVWQELVTSQGHSHHFVGVVRGRRSIEMAGQENIRLGLEKLSRVDLASLAPSGAGPLR
jgi:hypothetical protein